MWLAGCVPYFQHPLTPVDGGVDQRLLGTWRWKKDGGRGYIHVGRRGSSAGLKVVMVEFGEGGAMKVSELSGHVSSIGRNRYLNLRWNRPVQESGRGYLIVKYRFSGKGLGISLMNTDVVKSAVKSGELGGKIEKRGWLNTVVVTETGERLRRFIGANDGELFPEMKYLQGE